MGGRTARFANQAVRIRIAKFGCTNRPFYHIIAAKAYRARDAKPLELLGSYDPMPNDCNEKLVAINFERLHAWMRRGAKPSRHVEILLGLSGFFPVHPMCYITANRNKKAQRNTEQTESHTESLDEGTAV